MTSQIIPAILATNTSELNEYLQKIPAQATTIQIDIMDGNFVPSTSVSCDQIPPTKQHQEYHLMVSEPLAHIAQIQQAQSIIVHIETCKDTIKTVIQHIKAKKALVGIALHPSTPLSQITPYLAQIDIVLLMTVEPGLTGQDIIRATVDKITQARNVISQHNYSTIIEVDGGINQQTVCDVYTAGATRFVVGSAIMQQADPQKAMRQLEEQLQTC